MVFVIYVKTFDVLFVQIAIFTDFAIQIAQTFGYNIFRAIKMYKDIEKKLCICYYLSGGIVAFYTVYHKKKSSCFFILVVSITDVFLALRDSFIFENTFETATAPDNKSGIHNY